MAGKIKKQLKNQKVIRILTAGLLVLFVVFFLSSKFSSDKESPTTAEAGNANILDLLDTNSKARSLKEAQSLSEGNVSVTAKVVDIFEDTESGTKFLTLTDSTAELEALAFKNTPLPSLQENKEYTFKGTMQREPGDQYNELIIRSVD